MPALRCEIVEPLSQAIVEAVCFVCKCVVRCLGNWSSLASTGAATRLCFRLWLARGVGVCEVDQHLKTLAQLFVTGELFAGITVCRWHCFQSGGGDSGVSNAIQQPTHWQSTNTISPMKVPANEGPPGATQCSGHSWSRNVQPSGATPPNHM